MTNRFRNVTGRKMPRRRFLQATGLSGAGIASWGLVGCGGDDDDDTNGNGNGGASNGDDPTTAPDENGEAQTGGQIRIPYSGNFAEIDPITGSGGSDHQVLWAIFDNLVGYNPQLELDAERSLASSWEIVDPTTISMTLREGVVFHDGEPFNGEAVRTHIAYGQDTETSTVKADIDAIEDVEVVDDHSIVLHLSRPFSPLLPILGDRAGMVISPKAINDWGPGLNRTPIGAGAHKFVEEVLDSHLRVEAFADYWKDGCPQIDGVEWPLGISLPSQTSGLLSGELNLLWNPDPADIERMESEGFAVRMSPEPKNHLLFTNPNMAPWDNVHVRRAVAYAIDRETLNETIWHGVHRLGHSGWLDESTGIYHDPEFEGYTYNPEKVREELELAGFPDGVDLGRVNVLADPTYVSQGELIQSFLGEFGIEMTVDAKPNPDFFREYYDVEVPAFIATMSARADVWQQIAYTHAGDGPFDTGAIVPGGDPELEELFDKVASIYDEEERIEAMREVNERVHELVWHIVLLHQNTVYAHDSSIEFEMFGDGKPHLGQCDVRMMA